MPLGAFRLNSLAKAIAASGPTARTASTVTPLDNVQINESIYKFGYGSAQFDGSNDRIGVSFGDTSGTSGAFTIESWCRFDILPSSQTIGGGSYMMLFTVASNSYIMIADTGIQVADSGVYMTFNRPSGSLATNVWYHIAVTRDDSNVYRVFVDGVEYTPPASRTVSAQFCSGGTIGRFIDSRGSWDGYIDEFRISNVARYTAGFTPPTEPFVNDADTLLLMHMNGPTGSTNFFDDNSTLSATNFADGGQEFIIKEGETIYRVHRITSSSTFTVNESLASADLVVVGGGGAGGGNGSGSQKSGGGGGAAQVVQTSLALSPSSYTVTIGSGGQPSGNNQSWIGGSQTTFDSLVSAEGGAGGGTDSASAGGSATNAGGGGGGSSGNGGKPGGSGTLGGGNGSITAGFPGGGGGSNANAGGNGSSSSGGNGGNGVALTFLGGTSYIAGGGGGGCGGSQPPGTGGLGGGGDGGDNNNGRNALPQNTGSGGGGSSHHSSSRKGGDGSSGIVMVRYPI